MPKVVYIEPTDEIVDVVQRVRDTPDRAVALVLPVDAHLFQTPINLRLLAQFATREGRETSIISGEPRIQAMAQDAGLPIYASVPAYERGIELVHPHPATLGGPTAPPYYQQQAPAAARAGAVPPSRRATGKPWWRRRPAYFVAAGLAVVGLLLFLVVAPTAKVTVTIGATELSASPTIQGTADPAVATQGDHILTQVVTTDQSKQFTATPTGSQTVPPTPASGHVVFTTDLPFGSSFAIQKGEAFQTADTPPIVFYATEDVAVTVPPPTVPGQHGAASNPIPVQDGTPEAKGNVPPGAIKVWPRNPCNPDPTKPRLCSPSDLLLTNSAATAGGAAEKKLVIASDQDVQGFNTQIETLKKSLTDAAGQAMMEKAGGRQFALDGAGNGRSFATDVNPPLPKGGSQFTPTPITVTVHGKATVFSLDDVRRALVADLSAQVPKGETLAAEQVSITPPKITQAGDDGAVVLAETATAFSKPTVTLQGLKDTLAGKSPDDVRKLVERRIGRQVLKIQVDQKPFSSWPIMPFFSSRIDLVENFVAAHRPTS